MSTKKKKTPSEYYSSSDEDIPETEEETQLRIQEMMAKQFMRLNPNFAENDPSEKKKKARKKKLDDDEKNASPFYGKSFYIYIHLCSIKPRIWRRLRVPSDITLHLLHDKVLAPALGWARAYHAYYFKDYRAGRHPWKEGGVVFGDTKCQSVDMMHMGLHKIYMLDDREVKLAQLINQVGQKLIYLYDLGDSFRHKIVLEKIEDEYYDGTVELLGGERACPPENCGSTYSYGEIVDILKKKKRDQEYWEKNAECLHAPNYEHLHKQGLREFDPEYFDLKKAKASLALALRSKTSVNKGQNMFNMGLHPSFPSNEPQFKETTSIDPNKVKKNCAVCGVACKLRCGKCRIVFYCSREHQTDDWNNHKKICQKPTEN